MNCIECGHTETQVYNSRPHDEGASVMRRRRCLACPCRFTTYETTTSLAVKRKRDRERLARWRAENPELLARQREVYWRRQQAREEAARTGEDVYAVYQRWDVLLDKDKRLTPNP